MSDLDFNELITEGLIQGQADTAFRTRLKQRSGQALIKGQQRRLWYRRSSHICVVLLVAMSAFYSGRVTVKPQTPRKPIVSTNSGQNGDTILVARDLVAWLEAARFFQQLGMEERANKAFQLAGTLTPSREHPNQMARQNLETRLANLSHRENTLSSLLARYDTDIQQQHHETTPKAIPTVDRKHMFIIAQSIGGKNHGQ